MEWYAAESCIFGTAWLSSARAVRCFDFMSNNERKPRPLLFYRRNPSARGIRSPLLSCGALFYFLAEFITTFCYMPKTDSAPARGKAIQGIRQISWSSFDWAIAYVAMRPTIGGNGQNRSETIKGLLFNDRFLELENVKVGMASNRK